MKVFEPITIRRMNLKNRIVMSPMNVGVGLRGRRARAYYAERARGGVGTITAGAIFVDTFVLDEAWGRMGAVEEFLLGLKPLIEAVHQAGANIGIQLVHMNRLPLGLSVEDTRGEPIAPSSRRELDPPVVFLRPGEAMRELTIPEIEFIISKFAVAARNVKRSGFDFVEFHSAHGYLPCQFLSPLLNRRNDKYGGDLRGRMRFGINCISAIRDAVEDFPIFVRLGVEEGTPGGLTLAEGTEVAMAFEKAGADVISVSLADHVPTPLPTSDYPMGCFAYLAEAVKRKVSVPVMAVGRINSIEVAEDILAKGQADLIAIGRQLIAEPFWVNKAKEGKIEDVNPCLSCNSCLEVLATGELCCSVNAAAGREEEYQIVATTTPKKVLVVGGGPAGMEASRVAALRGHKVMLCERDEKLGGQLHAASQAPYKQTIGKLIKYLDRQVTKAGVEVKLNCEVTADFVIKEKPDVVILATGASPFIPDIQGVARTNVIHAIDVLNGRKDVGERAVIIGGELVACDVAEFLAAQNKRVTMLRRGSEMITKVALPLLRKPILDRLNRKGIIMLTGVKYEQITETGLIISNSRGQRRFIEADTIVLAAGARENQDLAKQLEGKVAAVYSIGDCVKPRRIREAIHEAWKVSIST
jgi:2,4-dienoyl-CoA reductase-like NADH-dependent reductase (Old Yellow Enzyme family)/thioredoxin reductase